MKKGFVLAILVVVSLIGCTGGQSPSEEPRPKLPPRQVNIQREIKAATNLPKGSLLVSTDDFKPTADLTPKMPNAFTPMNVFSGKQGDHLFQPWTPKPMMNERRELSKLWSLDIDNQYIKKTGYDKYEEETLLWMLTKYETLPEGWLIRYMNIKGVFDPKTGAKIENIKGGIGVSDLYSSYMIGGPSELGDANESSPALDYSLRCWNKKTNELRWKISNVVQRGGIFASDGCIYLLTNISLAKIDAWTGTVEWSISDDTNGRSPIWSPFYWQFTEHYMWLLYPREGSSVDEYRKNLTVCRLDPERLELMRINIGSVDGIVVKDNVICIVHDKINKMTFIDEQGVPQESVDVPEDVKTLIKPNNNISKESLEMLLPFGRSFISGGYMLFGSGDDNIHPFLFNPFTNNDPVLLPKNLKMTDSKQLYFPFPLLSWSDFYTQDNEYFYGFDVNEGKKTWSIPKSELGPNPAIAISDWRGVLVQDENQMTAWGAK